MFPGGAEGLGQPLEGLGPMDLATPISLHGTENGWCPESTSEFDHAQYEAKGLPALGGTGISKGKAVSDHSGSGPNGSDEKVVPVGEGLGFLPRYEVGLGKKKFNPVESVRFGLGEAFGQGIVEDERPGSGFGHLGQGYGALHGLQVVGCAT